MPQRYNYLKTRKIYSPTLLTNQYGWDVCWISVQYIVYILQKVRQYIVVLSQHTTHQTNLILEYNCTLFIFCRRSESILSSSPSIQQTINKQNQSNPGENDILHNFRNICLFFSIPGVESFFLYSRKTWKLNIKKFFHHFNITLH